MKANKAVGVVWVAWVVVVVSYFSMFIPIRFSTIQPMLFPILSWLTYLIFSEVLFCF